MLIFEHSVANRVNKAQYIKQDNLISTIPQEHLREQDIALPQLSELQVVRHYTQLSKLNFGIDTNFYPLGSCTMKYNPRGVHKIAMMPCFNNIHPLQLPETMQGTLESCFQLQQNLALITGMKKVALSPMAGAQGEFAGVAMIRAYHHSREDYERDEIIVPEAAHGTNPASAVMCGYKVREVAISKDGDVDFEKLRAIVGPRTAGIMLTNPSTLGVFERKIIEVQRIIHAAGGLSYYDGANLNAILGKVRPGDMGFDVIHMNLHKTFATPHGGGGPGSGPIGVSERLVPFLPVPTVIKDEDDKYRLATLHDYPQSIGKLSAFAGNTGILLRALTYIKILGSDGLTKVSEYATLNSNYLMKRLEKIGFTLAYPTRRASHEFIITLKDEAKKYGVTAKDVAKRLLDYGFHAPTTYFPLLVPECLLIEPTETETKQELDNFIEAMAQILEESKTNAELVTNAPHTMPIKRLDDVKAARDLDLRYQQG